MMNTLFYLSNHLEVGTLTATDTASGYNVNNLIDRRSYTKWRANTYGTKYITIDHGAWSSSTNGIAIFGHNFKTVNAAVSVEAYIGGIWELIYTFTITKDGAVCAKWTPITGSTQWRVKIVTTSGNIPEAAYIILSTPTEFSIPPDAPHTDYGEDAITESANSKSGNLLGVVNRGYTDSFSLKFSNISRSFADATLRDWWWLSFGRTRKPFIYVPDYNYDPTEVYFARAADDYTYRSPKSILAYYDLIEINLVGIRL